MAQYAYRARDGKGSMISGVMTADTQEDLTFQLRQQCRDQLADDGILVHSIPSASMSFSIPLSCRASVSTTAP